MFLFTESLLQMNKWTEPDPDLLTAFPFGNKDETASGLSMYFKLPQRRHRFSSWLSSNESFIKWILGKVIRRHMDSFRLDWSCDCPYPSIHYIFSLLIWYFMIGNISVQSRLIWTTFHTVSNHFCFTKCSLC